MTINDDDDDLSPSIRDRSYTWPLPPLSSTLTMRDLLTTSSTSSSKHHHGHKYFDATSHVDQSPSVGATSDDDESITPRCSVLKSEEDCSLISCSGDRLECDQHQHQQPNPKKKRSRKKPSSENVATKKPNPWGEASYSDLIAQALSNAPECRMKLNEIYIWFAENIPYFGDRSSQEEAAGWKVCLCGRS